MLANLRDERRKQKLALSNICVILGTRKPPKVGGTMLTVLFSDYPRDLDRSWTNFCLDLMGFTKGTLGHQVSKVQQGRDFPVVDALVVFPGALCDEGVVRAQMRNVPVLELKNHSYFQCSIAIQKFLDDIEKRKNP